MLQIPIDLIEPFVSISTALQTVNNFGMQVFTTAVSEKTVKKKILNGIGS